MLDQILTRAAEIWLNEEFDQDDVAFDAETAWGKAVTEFIRTDEDALAFVTEILGNEQLTTIVSWGEGISGDDSTFADMIRWSLYSREPFITFTKDNIPDYEQKLAVRKDRARRALTAEA